MTSGPSAGPTQAGPHSFGGSVAVPGDRGADIKLARRLGHIEPFYVMECAKAAQRIAASAACDPARGGERMLFLNIGEPDFTAPPLVQEAAERAIRDGRSQYTDALGLPALREAISGWYAQRFGLQIAADHFDEPMMFRVGHAYQQLTDWQQRRPTEGMHQ